MCSHYSVRVKSRSCLPKMQCTAMCPGTRTFCSANPLTNDFGHSAFTHDLYAHSNLSADAFWGHTKTGRVYKFPPVTMLLAVSFSLVEGVFHQRKNLGKQLKLLVMLNGNCLLLKETHERISRKKD